MISIYSHSQKTYNLDVPITAEVRGKVFIYDGIGYLANKVYNIETGDTVKVKGRIISSGRYLVDFKNCIDCAINSFFVVSNKLLDSIIDSGIDGTKQIERKAKREIDSLVGVRRTEEKIKMIDEYRSTCQYDKNEVDEFDGKLKRFTEKYCIEQEPGNSIGQFCIQLRRIGNNDYAVFEHFLDLGCTSSYASDKSVVLVKLESGDIVKFYHSGKLDCGSFKLFGKLTETDMVRLKNSPIALVRLEGTESYFDVDKISYKEVFMEKIDCLNSQ